MEVNNSSVTFYGDWILNVSFVGFNTWVYEIKGSNSSDGTYLPTVTSNIPRVSGQRWELELKEQLEGNSEFSDEIRLSPSFTVQEGLQVIVSRIINLDQDRFEITCTSLDPEIDGLPPSSNPFDFTISKDMIKVHDRDG